VHRTFAVRCCTAKKPLQCEDREEYTAKNTTTAKQILQHDKETLHGKRPEKTHGKEKRHGKDQCQHTAKKNAWQRPKKAHGKENTRHTIRRADLDGAVDGAVVTAGLCRVTYCHARQRFEFPNSTLAQKFPADCFITRENGLPELFKVGTMFAVCNTRQRILCRATMHGKDFFAVQHCTATAKTLCRVFLHGKVYFSFFTLFPSVFF
jgi:hypothetical protein